MNCPKTASHEPWSRCRVRGHFIARVPALFIVVALCFLGVSCSVPTVWEEKVPSPSGSWIAIARTAQNGGFGNSWIITSVLLEQAKIAETRTTVLSFSCRGPVPRPYTLDNKANAGGTINLTMKWLTPTHLEVSYDGSNGTLEFQAVKYQGIDISLRNLSNNATSPSQ